jgi:hypothetical protein
MRDLQMKLLSKTLRHLGIPLLASAALILGGCGTTTGSRTVSGAAMGAAGGAAIGSMSGNAGTGALIGAGAGALGGYVYDQQQNTHYHSN